MESIVPLQNKLIKLNKGEPVTLFINSEGGDVIAGLALADLISQHEVTCIGTGIVASSASIVFVSGKYKYLGPNAQVLIHQAKWCYGELLSVNETRDFYNRHLKLNQQLIDIYLRNSTLTLKQAKRLYYKETYLSAAESIHYGLANGYWDGEGLGAETIINSVTPKNEEGDDHDSSTHSDRSRTRRNRSRNNWCWS